MSILSEILTTGHVDKELLDALDDEQKQLLFCQMRAEQVRKWEAFEDRMNREGPPKKDPKKKKLGWLQDQAGEVWTWVMGEHPADATIEQILEEEARREAHQRALRELAQSSSSVAEDSNQAPSPSLPPEEALKAQLGSMRVGVTDSMYEDADGIDPDHPLLFKPNNKRAENGAPSPPVSTTVSSYTTPQPQRTEMRPPPHVPQKPQLPPKPTQNEPSGSSLYRSYGFPSTPTSSGGWQERKVEQPVSNGNGINGMNGVRLRSGSKSSTGSAEEDVKKRESEIFQSLQEQRERINREAEAEAQRQRREWELQERRAREAEAAMREMAQKAREQHRQLVRTSTSILPALKDTQATSLREAIKNLPRPPKPKCRQAIIDWFRREEFPRGTGLDPKTRAPAPWFHGIISRDHAEVLLRDKPTGSFLVRVSERIWGYTVSYVVGDGSFKHFLVERIAEGYQFLGTNQVVHDQLFDLVSYHESAPITAKGGEILKWAVGQGKSYPLDYEELMPGPTPYPSRYVAHF